jgi:adenylate cyclase
MQDCYEEIAEAYKIEGDFKKAMEYTDNYTAIKDSIFSQENAKKIKNLEMQRQEEADSMKNVNEQHLADIKFQHQRNYTYLGIAGILALLVFSFFIVRERGKSEKERKTSDGLLLNILPSEVAQELKTTGTSTARQFDNVTVLFTDFVGFTKAGERMSPQALVEELNTCFKKFDDIISRHGIEKIKTVGDAYLAAAGLPLADPQHAQHAVQAAVEIAAYMEDRLAKLGDRTFDIRIGIHSGSVVAGIVGNKKFAYDIWGDTVNTAARMEQNSEAGKINISQSTYELVKDKFDCEYRGEIDAKNKGMMKMYYVD